MTRGKEKITIVAGGAGFVGSHLCEKLLNKGHHILCLDNLCTGNLKNIQHLRGNKLFKFKHHDIVSPIEIENVSMIYNLTCPASPTQYQKNPIHTFKTSVIGSLNLLELAKKNRARILLASTSEVYGNPMVEIQSESYWGNVNTYGIRSCYDEGKRGAETLFHDYNQMYDVDTRIIRIFNTYGPRMSIEDGRVVSNFIVQALRGEPLTIYGNGRQTRSFLYIDDLVNGILQVMNDGVIHSPINIGNPHEITIKDFALIVCEMTHSKSTMIHKPSPLDDPSKRRPDITLAMNTLKEWRPVVDLRCGLYHTIEYFQSIMK